MWVLFYKTTKSIEIMEQGIKEKVKNMNSKIIVAVFLISLLSFPLFLNPVVAQDDDVVITIKGGFLIKFSIENNTNDTIRADFNVTTKGPRSEFENIGKDIPIEPDDALYYRLAEHHLVFISVSIDVEGHSSLTRKGIGFMYFAIFLT